MQLVGTIGADDASSADQGEWIAPIGKHTSLAAPHPKQGINPFTKQPHLWATDGSHRLIVWSAPGAISHVTDIALDVA